MTPATLFQHPFSVRHLIACHDCARQYDASSLQADSKFHCLCGQLLSVPQPRSHDAAVVRCSSCGGPRQGSGLNCGFCGADFTLHERDLHTICPECMTRVSDRAKFCHHCACPLLPAELAGEPSTYNCPVCGDPTRLTTRKIEPAGIAVLECPRCAGLWISGEEFAFLKERSRNHAARMDDEEHLQSKGRQPALELQQGPLYRPCPFCNNLMNRRNYGRHSGVIIDSCRDHGVWFDANELDTLLRWIRSGGEAAAYRRQQDELDEAKRQAAMKRFSEAPDQGWARPTTPPTVLGDLLGWLTGTFEF